MRSWAEWLYDNRFAAGFAILSATLFFALQLPRLQVTTLFHDLYPRHHPHTELFHKYPRFASPLSTSLVVQVKNGTLYRPDTLAKIQEATRLVDLIPGVDHDQILSIASRKIKFVDASGQGMRGSPLVGGTPPTTSEALEELQKAIYATPGILGVLVSAQEDAAIIQAGFIERLADYETILRHFNAVIDKLKDKDHDIYAAGPPVLNGWVHDYTGQTLAIFALPITGMVLLLIVHMRNLAGTIMPIVVSATTVIWGLGIAAALRISVDPLTLVVPMLLIARSFSHAIQAGERYFEIYAETGDKKEACVGSLTSIFPPGLLGIVTDAAGLFLIAVAPIPLMEKLALISGFWALSMIPANLMFTPLVLSILPVPSNASVVVRWSLAAQQSNIFSSALEVFERAIDGLLKCTVSLSGARIAWRTLTVLCLVFAGAALVSSRLVIGDPTPGTSLLWPDSPYNTAVSKINQRFAGFDLLQVIVESAREGASIQSPGSLDLMQRFQRHMERDPAVAATFSFADLVTEVNRQLHGGVPKWRVIPESEADAAMLTQLALTGASAEDFDRLFTRDRRAANIEVWYKDHTTKTIGRALQRASQFTTDGASEFKLALASGSLGLLAAINQAVSESQVKILLLASATVFVTSALTYGSLVAAFILLIPVLFSNLVASAVMVFLGIGLNVNTLPVTAIGIGVGIDYAIYLMSRTREESKSSEPSEAIRRAILSTGRAILFTACMIIAVMAPWYFLSSLRFQAEMGLLIGCLMLINMAAAMLIVPLALSLLRPKFLTAGNAK